MFPGRTAAFPSTHRDNLKDGVLLYLALSQFG